MTHKQSSALYLVVAVLIALYYLGPDFVSGDKQYPALIVELCVVLFFDFFVGYLVLLEIRELAERGDGFVYLNAVGEYLSKDMEWEAKSDSPYIFSEPITAGSLYVEAAFKRWKMPLWYMQVKRKKDGGILFRHPPKEVRT